MTLWILHRKPPDAKGLVAHLREALKVNGPAPHPLFRIVSGGVREWERAQS